MSSELSVNCFASNSMAGAIGVAVQTLDKLLIKSTLYPVLAAGWRCTD